MPKDGRPPPAAGCLCRARWPAPWRARRGAPEPTARRTPPLTCPWPPPRSEPPARCETSHSPPRTPASSAGGCCGQAAKSSPAPSSAELRLPQEPLKGNPPLPPELHGPEVALPAEGAGDPAPKWMRRARRHHMAPKLPAARGSNERQEAARTCSLRIRLLK